MRNISPRQGTETDYNCSEEAESSIEKYKSPTGDGNYPKSVYIGIPPFILRNISPRQGTETIFSCFPQRFQLQIEKYKSPTGDGNLNLQHQSLLLP